MLGKPEVDPTDEPRSVAEDLLEDWSRSSDFVERDTGDGFAR